MAAKLDRNIHFSNEKSECVMIDFDAQPNGQTFARFRSAQEMLLHLAAIVESSDDAIISKTLEGIIKSWNPGAQRLYGYSAEEVVGQSISILVPPDRPDEVPRILETIKQGGRIDHYETSRVRKDGEHIDVSLTISPVREASGTIIGASTIARDVTERKRADEVVARLAAIVESSDDAIISKTLEGIIKSWNKGAERIYGYTQEEVLGRPISILVPSDRPDEVPQILERLRKGEKIDHYETERITKDSRRIHVSLTISPIKTASGEITGAAVIARDVTERKEMEEDLRRLNQELERRVLERTAQLEATNKDLRKEIVERERLEKLKDEFIGVASHELRTPVTVVWGYTKLALRTASEEGNEQLIRMIRIIDEKAQHLTRLVDQMLDISRIDRGVLPLERQSLDLCRLIQDVVSDVTVAVRNFTFNLDLPAEPIVVNADRERIGQVVTNLVENAIKYVDKYSEDGRKVEITAKLEGGEAVVAVRDYGVGIPADQQEQVFGRFFRGRNVTSARYPYPGVGLGLFVARDIIDRHGGRMWLESEEGAGSTFYFTLPYTGS
jgi:PAS domain S-box-containing protein